MYFLIKQKSKIRKQKKKYDLTRMPNDNLNKLLESYKVIIIKFKNLNK